MSGFKHAWLAIRPKTLSISITPIMVGTTLAWTHTGEVYWPVVLAAALAALLIQAGTNLHNDAADFERGADTTERLGPARAAAQGWFSGEQIKRGALLSFLAAFLIGIYLVWVGGWPILMLGIAALLAAYAYTGGPSPIAYTATGELFVFLFFGLAAVLGSYYLQTQSFSSHALLAGGAIGLLAAAVLLVNNYRDLETDRRAGKLTLVHYLGRHNARLLYAGLLLTPFLLPVILHRQNSGSWLILGTLPFALMLIRRFFTEPPGEGLNNVLAATAKLQLGFGVALSLGLSY